MYNWQHDGQQKFSSIQIYRKNTPQNVDARRLTVTIWYVKIHRCKLRMVRQHLTQMNTPLLNSIDNSLYNARVLSEDKALINNPIGNLMDLIMTWHHLFGLDLLIFFS